MASEIRIGHGFDVHRFRRGRKLMLGGVEIPHSAGLMGHSDADVLLHAITDAVLKSWLFVLAWPSATLTDCPAWSNTA